MTETAGDRLKRLRMRSWRRGIKEMDLILGAYADDKLASLSEADLAVYDRMLAENDHDLYQWVTGRAGAPDDFASLIERVSAHAGIVK